MKVISIFALVSVVLFALNFNNDFPFDKSKLQNYDEKSSLDSFVGVIKNQVWISSKKLSQEELRILVLSKYEFKVIGYHKIFGLLVEFDESDKNQLQILSNIKALDSIDNVYNRVYEGKHSADIMPNN